MGRDGAREPRVKQDTVRQVINARSQLSAIRSIVASCPRFSVWEDSWFSFFRSGQPIQGWDGKPMLNSSEYGYNQL